MGHVRLPGRTSQVAMTLVTLSLLAVNIGPLKGVGEGDEEAVMEAHMEEATKTGVQKVAIERKSSIRSATTNLQEYLKAIEDEAGVGGLGWGLHKILSVYISVDFSVSFHEFCHKQHSIDNEVVTNFQQAWKPMPTCT